MTVDKNYHNKRKKWGDSTTLDIFSDIMILTIHNGITQERKHLINIPTVVLTSDKNKHLLKGFAHQFDKHAGVNNEVIIAGFNPPDFRLPPNYAFYSISNYEYPAHLWSDAVIQFLQVMPHEIMLVLLEDYWCNKEIDVRAINHLSEYMVNHRDILRMDLTSDILYKNNSLDRISGPGAKTIDTCHYLDIIEVKPPCEYAISLQAAIWRKSLLLKYLVPGESPWQFEWNGTTRLNKDWPSVRFLGTRQNIMTYVNVSKAGHHGILLNDGFNCFREEDVRELEEIGAI